MRYRTRLAFHIRFSFRVKVCMPRYRGREDDAMCMLCKYIRYKLKSPVDIEHLKTFPV